MPNMLFLLGVQKCGTSTLHRTLIQHSEIECAVNGTKEVAYFGRRNYRNGPDWYRNLWTNGHKYNVDATPGYASSKIAISRIAKQFPNARLLLTIRCPVKRAVSQYNHYMQIMEENPHDWRAPGGSLMDNISGELRDPFCGPPEDDWGGILGRGLYNNQIQNILAHFPAKQLLVLVLEEWKHNINRTIRYIVRWLGLEPESIPVVEWNRRPYTISTTDEEITKLRQFYKGPNEELFKFLGRKPSGWE